MVEFAESLLLPLAQWSVSARVTVFLESPLLLVLSILVCGYRPSTPFVCAVILFTSVLVLAG